MRLASNFSGLLEHGKLVLLYLLNGGTFADIGNMILETGVKRVPTDRFRKYVKIEERYYTVIFNRFGNIKDAYCFATTYKGKELEIGKFKVIARYATYSDRGSHLINGLLFENGYGDGVNSVEVRKFKDTNDLYHSRSEIYDKPLCITPWGDVSVWENDSADVNEAHPLICLNNCFKIIINRRKLILCVK